MHNPFVRLFCTTCGYMCIIPPTEGMAYRRMYLNRQAIWSLWWFLINSIYDWSLQGRFPTHAYRSHTESLLSMNWVLHVSTGCNLIALQHIIQIHSLYTFAMKKLWGRACLNGTVSNDNTPIQLHRTRFWMPAQFLPCTIFALFMYLMVNCTQLDAM